MSTWSGFQIVGPQLTGYARAFDVAMILSEDPEISATDRGKQLTDVAEELYRAGRASAILSSDDRFELHAAIDSLRALSVVVGPTPTGDRHRRAADLLAQLLHDQEIHA